MTTLTLPAIPAAEIEAVPCAVCGADASPASVPLCSAHHSDWCGSPSWRIAFEVETKLREAFAVTLRERQAKERAS